jgi:hypothetical protein
MNRRLTDHHIRSTCSDLLAQHGPRVSGRTLRRTLKQRYGAVGKTERVFRIWRELVQRPHATLSPTLPTDVVELQRRLLAAEATATQATERAELSALREQSHQDKWAAEVDQLRQQLGAQPGTLAQIRTLQDQMQRLTMELMSARAMLARYEDANELLRSESTEGRGPA